MARVDKILERWRNRKPREVPKGEVSVVLNAFSGFQIDQKRGSHVVVRHELLKGVPNFGPDGEFSFPVKNGRVVKGVYLKSILEAVDLVREATQ